MAFIQFQLRRGTESQWTSANPTLAAGEMGVETDTGKFKIGDGTTAWNTLDYGGLVGATGPTGATGATGPQGEAGPPGAGLELKGVLNDEGELPGSGDPTPDVGDAYLIGTVLYVWDGTEFVSADLRGPQGEPGEGGAGDGFAFKGEWNGSTPYDEGDIVSVSDNAGGQSTVHFSLYRAKQEFTSSSPDPRTFPEAWDFVSGYNRTANIFSYVGTKDPQVDELNPLDVFNQGPGTGLSFFTGSQVVPFAAETNFSAPPMATVFADPVAWSAGEYQANLMVEYTVNSTVLVFISNTTTSAEPTQSGDWNFVNVRPRLLNDLNIGTLNDLTNVTTNVSTLSSGDVLTYDGQFQRWFPVPAPKHTFTYGSFSQGSFNTVITGDSTPLTHISPSNNWAILNPIHLLHPGTVELTLTVWDPQDPSDHRVVNYTYFVNGQTVEELSKTVVEASTNLTDFDIVLTSDSYQNAPLFVNDIILITLVTDDRDTEDWPVFVSVRPLGDAKVAPDEAFGS